jgi:hypothetical protein
MDPWKSVSIFNPPKLATKRRIVKMRKERTETHAYAAALREELIVPRVPKGDGGRLARRICKASSTVTKRTHHFHWSV